MFTSDTGKEQGFFSKHLRKTSAAYLGTSVFCVILANVYAIFGHGVRSFSMDFMFLYPFLGGTLFFFILGLAYPSIVSRRRFRAGYNLYNSGIAALTVGALLQGVVEIAGADSEWIVFFTAGGAALLLAAVLLTAVQRTEPAGQGTR